MYDPDAETEQDTWKVLSESVPCLLDEEWQEVPQISQLLCANLDEHLAIHLIRQCRKKKTHLFLSEDRVHAIAAEQMESDRVKWETDLPTYAGLYVFTSVVDSIVVKVGEASDLRTRITSGHLRYGNRQSDSNVIDYYGGKGAGWPQPLLNEMITLLVFPMPRSSLQERRFIEFGLSKLLRPLMK